MSEPGQAVFPSHASHDAEATRRIAEALRAAGVEVWLDAEGGQAEVCRTADFPRPGPAVSMGWLF